MASKIFFVSDLHLGTEYPDAPPERDIHFCDFLKQIEGNASHLFILGDMFEFWMEYAHYIPKHHFNVLARILQLVENGVEVHYLSGNHDFNLGRFFGEKLGIHIHHSPFEITLQGKSLHLLHGDGMAVSDWKYRLIKRIIVHPLSNWWFKLLHPDLGMLLAKFVGKKSYQHQTKISPKEYHKTANNILQGGDAGIVMHGHTHSFFIKETNNGLHINTGSWIKQMHYVEMAEGVCSLKTFVPDDAERKFVGDRHSREGGNPE